MALIAPSIEKKLIHSGINLAGWTQTMKRSILRQMLAVASRPGILSFAGGLPATEMFPAADYAGAVSRVLAADPGALQYGPPFAPLKRHIVDLMAMRGVVCGEEQIFITTGAQQALNVLSRLLLDPGGQVIVEEMVYTGIRQVLEPYQPQILTIPTDLEFGLDVSAAETILLSGAKPAFLYAIPEAHNPLGVSIHPQRQEKLIALARYYRMPIVEDDPYGLLSYDSTAVPPLRALDEEWVFYVGSFSKILAPALRLGWIVVPQNLIPRLTVVKEASDLETSRFIQRTVSEYLDRGHLPEHLNRLRRVYKIRRDAMLGAIGRHFPAGTRMSRPSGGMFIWVELAPHIDTAEILPVAINESKVAYIPGIAFAANPQSSIQANNCLRLNFSNCSPELIEDGISRLGRLLHRYY
jgi:2-aminoadipate transaminase